MEAFLTSTTAITLAEIGDKTQLLTLFLVARFNKKWPVIMGILVATIVNHGLTVWFGERALYSIPAETANWVVGISFILLGFWLLVPDKDESTNSKLLQYNAFWATTVLFFIAEIGDKTQVATLLLAANYQSFWWVTIGTTLGMLLANVPVALSGEWVMRRFNLSYVHYAASAGFVISGIYMMLA